MKAQLLGFQLVLDDAKWVYEAGALVNKRIRMLVGHGLYVFSPLRLRTAHFFKSLQRSRLNFSDENLIWRSRLNFSDEDLILSLSSSKFNLHLSFLPFFALSSVV